MERVWELGRYHSVTTSRRYAEDKPTLSKHEGKDCALFVATNEADTAIVEAHDLAGETQTNTLGSAETEDENDSKLRLTY